MATSRNENVQLNHAAPARPDAVTTKRQCLPVATSSSRAINRVFDVETLLQGLLAMLDLSSLVSLLEVLAVDDSWRSVLSHDHLWKEMLNTHFGGNLPPAEQFNDTEEQEESEQEDEDDEEREEEDDEDEPDLIEILEVDVEMDDDASLLGEEEEIENEDDASDVELIPRPRATRSINQTSTRPENTESVADTRQAPAVSWIAGVPSKKVLDAACPDLKEFLQSAVQLVHFDTHVQILRGDIGEIQTVGDQRVDGLAFPTSSFLRNPHTGAASVIFRRAGQGLTDYVPTMGIQLDVGDAIATPGFDAGVDKLIHCVGPSGFNLHCLRDLQRTYRSVLRCIQEENLTCVAMASISTGNMGMPVDNAAWFALCAIQRYMRSTDWTATIAIVCFEAQVYAAFTKSKRKLVEQFNADALRAIPPLRNR
ncbi:hypothetical protein L914_12772 [Phytophthora nicotianae]|uniref:Macro domain-containing protein n=2 Tax=Phytophthora nicotianae TaxID=4792 RepID=V9ESP0_PHYNI|nr:hypothetical protein F443_13270 [Phytophthora nicotianae P1569]ETM41449.1 hypothetical protein L914_12772 [Phytophthora nicotianae]